MSRLGRLAEAGSLSDLGLVLAARRLRTILFLLFGGVSGGRHARDVRTIERAAL